jgi:adenylate kinase
MKLVFLGPPGAGKGTIAALVKEHYRIPHISTGELFRAHIKGHTPLGLEVEAILARGDLVPDDITVEMVRVRLAEADAHSGFILDGFPRTIDQADALDQMVRLDRVVNFVLDEEVIIARLSGRRVCPVTGKIYHLTNNPPKVEGVDDETGEPLIQRDDDRPEAIHNRLEVYQRQTFPLIEYYRTSGLVVDIDASPTPIEVFGSLEAVLGR